MIKRVFVEKKKGFDIEAEGLFQDLAENLNIIGMKSVRIVNRYDIEGISQEIYEAARGTIFSEPPVDVVYDEKIDIPEKASYFTVAYLPGQYDQRADSAVQCMQLLSMKEKPVVRSAKLIIIEGEISIEDFERIKNYYINPVDSYEVGNQKPETLEMISPEPSDVEVVKGFITMNDEEIEAYRIKKQFAMSKEDILLIRGYFAETEKREPTITELKVLDTYWSDHCRHTTFSTKITDIVIGEEAFAQPIRQMYEQYLNMRSEIYKEKEKDITLMDMAVIGTKYLKQKGKVNDLDESDEINACSIKVKAKIDGENRDWIVMFKNETHNHPTEIEPFGGAATCLGGAIRDPLSGRSYVYQAMRVTGSGDPRTKIENTLAGKLPQKKITKEAARGYSSYGNQIGIATGQVSEIYDEGYVAKRMEVGAVIGAAPAENIIREKPESGDCIILLGGRTGRDGLGGATGSSKEHTEESVLLSGAEVQKGNPPTERNLQRLFRRKDAAALIKRCNDFGAGGVSVAVGELADSIDVNLDMILKKYEGLDGTELAISESQERMAVVVAPENEELFISKANEENLEAVKVAEVTDNGYFRMFWREKKILDLSREFLDTNGAKQETKVVVNSPKENKNYFKEEYAKGSNIREQWINAISVIDNASQKGLVERFDSTIGAGTVLMPLGGKNQLTPAEGMAAKLPVLEGECDTATLMAYGFNPKLAKWSPFHGGFYAVIDSVTKLVAMGGYYKDVRLSLQEYFEKLGTDSTKWGKPFAAILGALKAQTALEIPAIGGKDSMSGTFKELTVPPSLISFGVSTVDAGIVTSPELKASGSIILMFYAKRDEHEIIDFDNYNENMELLHKLITTRKALSVKTVGEGGIAVAITKMCVGNEIGVSITLENKSLLFEPAYGSVIIEMDAHDDIESLLGDSNYYVIGKTIKEKCIKIDEETFELKDIVKDWTAPLESIFPTKTHSNGNLNKIDYQTRNIIKPRIQFAKPTVFIPAFPGTNCEFDSKRAFERAGANGVIQTFRNMSTQDITDSIEAMVKNIRNAQIIMIPGGFSGGDEPDGSAKFITAVFRNPYIKEAVTELLEKRDGLILGVCNGFQALIKLGLVPYGEIREMTESDPTLTFNTIGRHVSTLIQTAVSSVKSPWLSKVNLGDVHTLPVSHGEGRFIGSEQMVKELFANGQIATRYVTPEGNPSMAIAYNPNGSFEAIEGITSPDGRVFGKMAHSERIGKNLYRNIYGDMDQKLFEAGVDYFR